MVSLLDYTPTPTYNPSDSYDTNNVGYGWVFPIDGKSEPDCASASSTSPRGSSMPSMQSLCEALPEEIVMEYLSNHEEITNAIGRSLTGITSENSMTDVFHSLQNKGEIEMVPGKTGSASAWRKKDPDGGNEEESLAALPPSSPPLPLLIPPLLPFSPSPPPSFSPPHLGRERSIANTLLLLFAVLYVATVHFRTPKWIDVQQSYLRRNIGEPFKTFAVLDGIDEEYHSRFDRVVAAKGTHEGRLNLLAAEISVVADPDDVILFLDGDAFPVADPMPTIRRALASTSLIAVRRNENQGDRQPHPSFCAVTVGEWKRLHGDWSAGYVWTSETGLSTSDVGGNLLGILERGNIQWTPLVRTKNGTITPSGSECTETSSTTTAPASDDPSQESTWAPAPRGFAGTESPSSTRSFRG